MRVKQSNIAALAALFLGVGTAASTVPGQVPAQPAPPDRQTAGKANENCANLGLDAEQIRELVRNMPQEEQLAELARQLAKEEAVMSSPELRKIENLSAQLSGRQGELEAKAEDMAARAQELTSRVEDQLQDNRILVSPDEGGGWLGVAIGEVTPEKAAELKLSSVRGVIVTDVEPDSPATKAGLKENDVLLQYDGQVVEGTVQFRRLVRETPPGRKVDVQISRDGRTQTLGVELADRSAVDEKRMRGMMNDFGKPFSLSGPRVEINAPGGLLWSETRAPLLGIEAEDLTGQLGSYFGAPDNSGVLVREVRAGGPAQKAGIKAGDVIIKIDDKRVESLSDLREQLRQDRDHKTIRLGLLRKGSALTLSIEIEQPKPPEAIDAIHRAEL
ncbi:MAG TPA: PDZ domain-containing protein [Candidatus Cybelea sp.]|nr:PDZ domain-containing protein [Candidatus Cybelea sp.]